VKQPGETGHFQDDGQLAGVVQSGDIVAVKKALGGPLAHRRVAIVQDH